MTLFGKSLLVVKNNNQTFSSPATQEVRLVGIKFKPLQVSFRLVSLALASHFRPVPWTIIFASAQSPKMTNDVTDFYRKKTYLERCRAL